MEGLESRRFPKLVYPRFGGIDGDRGKPIKSCRYQTSYSRSFLVSVKTTRYTPLVVAILMLMRTRKFIM